MDIAGYIILLNQLVVLILRLYLATLDIDWVKWMHAAIFSASYIINETTLYFFVYEMKYIKIKIESDNLESYNHRKKSVQNWKYIFISIQIFIQLPLSIVAMGLSTNQQDLEMYYTLILSCVAVQRFLHLALAATIYNQFARLFTFYLEKKRNLVHLRSISFDDRKFNFTRCQRFVICWVCFLFIFKILAALIELTWQTYF